jgi:hypothetical protein
MSGFAARVGTSVCPATASAIVRSWVVVLFCMDFVKGLVVLASVVGLVAVLLVGLPDVLRLFANVADYISVASSSVLLSCSSS